MTRSKNHMHIKCRYFSRKNLATGGVEPPPKMPLMGETVKASEIFGVLYFIQDFLRALLFIYEYEKMLISSLVCIIDFGRTLIIGSF